jgi:EAL domain-containing protein (putative c-di-GMP-specific phosphodiesterase class I)
LSRASLSYERLPDEIYETAKKHGVPTDMVKFEVTETAYNDNPEQLVSVVKRLQNYGFTIMMDDFGSGYSSLNTLKDLPIDVLKIDMCFLRDMETNARAGTILTSIVRMTKWLDIPIVAEGVETYNHANFLKNIGCDHMQGYLFSRPLPPDEYLQVTWELKDRLQDKNLTR